MLDRGGELREHRGGEAVHLGLDGGELGLERRGEGRGEVRGGLGHHAELIVVVGAGEVAEDLDSFGEEEAELVEVELARGVDVETDEDGLEVLHAGGGGGLLGNAEDARELLVLGEAPGDLGEGHGAGAVRIALVEDAPDLGLLLVGPLGHRACDGSGRGELARGAVGYLGDLDDGSHVGWVTCGGCSGVCGAAAEARRKWVARRRFVSSRHRHRCRIFRAFSARISPCCVQHVETTQTPRCEPAPRLFVRG